MMWQLCTEIMINYWPTIHNLIYWRQKQVTKTLAKVAMCHSASLHNLLCILELFDCAFDDYTSILLTKWFTLMLLYKAHVHTLSYDYRNYSYNNTNHC